MAHCTNDDKSGVMSMAEKQIVEEKVTVLRATTVILIVLTDAFICVF